MKNIPESFIYEILNGQKIYRKGYLLALKLLTLNPQKIQEMGCSSLQAYLIKCIVTHLERNLSAKKWLVLFNEIGLHLDSNDNLAGDIVIYDRKKHQKQDFLTKHFLSFPPEIVIEIDIKIEEKQFENPENYVRIKTQKLLDFGVEKVIWVFSEEKIVLFARKNSDLEKLTWENNIELLDNYLLNIDAVLKEDEQNWGD
ncbi:MAG: Uma2 family endonuclease [Bacteroidetes bacterium]|nr:MAG: Uma2 family endonuclease [Bacteroidota bacterium]